MFEWSQGSPVQILSARLRELGAQLQRFAPRGASCRDVWDHIEGILSQPNLSVRPTNLSENGDPPREYPANGDRTAEVSGVAGRFDTAHGFHHVVPTEGLDDLRLRK